MKTTTKPFDPAEYLTDGETMAAYIDEALATGEAQVVGRVDSLRERYYAISGHRRLN